MEEFNEKLFEDKIRDTFIISKKNCEKRCTNFLDPREQMLAEEIAKDYSFDMKHFFYGGYEDSERKVLVAYPEYLEYEQYTVPICAVRVTSKDPNAFLGHRDYMGALLGLGIKREMLGDILVGENSADIILKDEILEFVGLNLVKVGNTTVDIEEISLRDLTNTERPYKEIKGTVASLRLDSIASLAFRVSRSKMASFIKGENVRLNFKTESNAAAEVKEGDMISVNRMGRAKVAEIGGKSKKNRTFVKMHKYISR